VLHTVRDDDLAARRGVPVRELVRQHEVEAARELGLTRENVLEGLRDALEMAR